LDREDSNLFVKEIWKQIRKVFKEAGKCITPTTMHPNVAWISQESWDINTAPNSEKISQLRNRDNRDLNKITKELTGGHNHQQKVIFDKNGKLLVSNDDQLKSW
jgi:hypothetical protein